MDKWEAGVGKYAEKLTDLYSKDGAIISVQFLIPTTLKNVKGFLFLLTNTIFLLGGFWMPVKKRINDIFPVTIFPPE